MIEVLCSVRGCGQPLTRGERQWICPTGHSFDVARSGYCNLLQPQERRSKHPGDSAEAVQARRRLFDRSIGELFLDEIEAIACAMNASGPLLDAGCGEGYYLAGLCSRLRTTGVGIDISTPSIDLAAKTHPSLVWIVSNIDRRIPLGDRSIGAVLSITSKINASEFARVLREDGLLIVATPGDDDLAELREKILGTSRPISTVPDIGRTEHGTFTLVRQVEAAAVIEADREVITDLLRSTYRGQRRSQSEAVSGLTSLSITHSRNILAFRLESGRFR